MKRIAFIFIIICLTNNTLALDTLRYNEKVTRQLKLEFNEKAKEEDGYIIWELIGDAWEKVNVSVNQGRLRGGRFTIRANDYQDFADGEYGIVITIAPRKRIDEGSYRLRMDVLEVSPELRFVKSDLNLDESFYFLPLPPKPWWIILLYWLAAIFVLFNILWFAFLKKMIYPKMTGTLQFSDGTIVKLNGCYAFYLYTSHKKPSYAKSGLLSGMYQGKKGGYHIPYPEEMRSDKKFILIKPVKTRKGFINNLDKVNGIELLSAYKKLYHEEEYIFKDPNDDMEIKILYDNLKHQM